MKTSQSQSHVIFNLICNILFKFAVDRMNITSHAAIDSVVTNLRNIIAICHQTAAEILDSLDSMPGGTLILALIASILFQFAVRQK